MGGFLALAAAGCLGLGLPSTEAGPAPGTSLNHETPAGRRESMSEETLRRQLYESFANRARVYHLIFEELRAELGAARAAEVLGRAIYRRGSQQAARYAPFAPRDLVGLKGAFLAALPDGGALFAPEVVRCDGQGLDITFHRCPLKEAWLDAGLTQEEVAALCRIAAEVDRGLFETAGFGFHADTYVPGGEGCCFLHVRPGAVLGQADGPPPPDVS
jgi:hypothetical protein